MRYYEKADEDEDKELSPDLRFSNFSHLERPILYPCRIFNASGEFVREETRKPIMDVIPYGKEARVIEFRCVDCDRVEEKQKCQSKKVRCGSCQKKQLKVHYQNWGIKRKATRSKPRACWVWPG